MSGGGNGIVPSGNGGGGLPINSLIERAVLDERFDVAKLDALLTLQAREQARMARLDFNRAMNAAQSAMAPVVRDALNQHTKSRYAKLETISRQAKPVYTSHGFSLRYGSAQPSKPGNVRITCHVAHDGGHEEPPIELEAPLDLIGTQGKVNKTDVQGLGATVSYLRRYLLCLAFDIVLADEDTDGEIDDDEGGATKPPNKQRNGTGHWLDGLETKDVGAWLRNLETLTGSVSNLRELAAVSGHHSVLTAKRAAPTTIRRNVEDMIAKAHERLAPKPDPDPPAEQTEHQVQEPTDQDDEAAIVDADERKVLAMIAEVDAIGALQALDRLATDARWRGRLRDLFPPDEDRVIEAITLRRAFLQNQEQQGKSS